MGDVRGVGPRLGAQLRAAGVATALDLARLDPVMIRRRWSVVLERTVRELRGWPCIDLENSPQPKQQIAVTRSFGRPVRELPALIEAISTYAARAAEKLRRQGSLTRRVPVFAHTSPFRPGPRWTKTITVPMPMPTADTARITEAALNGLQSIFEPGHDLVKAGVMLLDLSADRFQQRELLDSTEERAGRAQDQLMRVIDRLNARWGKATVQHASTGSATARRDWSMRQTRLTPQYTTDWGQVPTVRA